MDYTGKVDSAHSYRSGDKFHCHLPLTGNFLVFSLLSYSTHTFYNLL